MVLLTIIHMAPWTSCQIHKLRVAHAPGMPGTFSPPPRVSDPDMHHGTCVTHTTWCMPGSLDSDFIWNRWRGKRCLTAFVVGGIRHYYLSRCDELAPGIQVLGREYGRIAQNLKDAFRVIEGNPLTTGGFHTHRDTNAGFHIFFYFDLINERMVMVGNNELNTLRPSNTYTCKQTMPLLVQIMVLRLPAGYISSYSSITFAIISCPELTWCKL